MLNGEVGFAPNNGNEHPIEVTRRALVNVRSGFARKRKSYLVFTMTTALLDQSM